MAPIKRTKTSSTAATPSELKSSIHVADPNSAPVYADQSRSRLMTLPEEIRNIIFTYVFCDNIERVREPIRYEPCDSERKTVMADVPIRVRLDESSPPSKDTILACRELYSEIKEMYAAAYRAYRSGNRFVYEAGLLGTTSVLPADKDLQHVQEFCILLANLRDYYIHLVITAKGGWWDAWLLPVDGRILQSDNIAVQHVGQPAMRAAVEEYMNDIWTPLDPHQGQGLTLEMLRGISNNREVIDAIKDLHDFDRMQYPPGPAREWAGYQTWYWREFSC